MGFNFIELVGYVASALVLASFFFKNIKHLRIVNSFGCAFFVAYGILLGSVPILITNVAILLVNGYYLFLKNKKS